MFKGWGALKKLYFGFIFMLVVVFLTSICTFYKLYKIDTNVKRLKERIEKVGEATKIEGEILKNIQLSVALMLTTNDLEKRKQLYERILKSREEYGKVLEFLKTTTRSEEGKKELSEAIHAISTLRESNNKVIELALAGKTIEALGIHETEVFPKIETMKKELDDVVNFHLKRANKETSEVLSVIRVGWIVFAIAGLIFLGVSFFVAFSAIRTVRNLIEKIRTACVTLASSSEELSTITRQFSSSLSTQTEKTTQIAGSVEEMSTTVADIAKSAVNLFDESKKTATIAKEGEAHTLKTAEEVKAIERNTKTLREVMAKLEDRAKEIESVVEFIKEVAEQTNLLALNATIEAARAGEHGKSFAVVAGEIRKLAERTGKSTEEIAGIIKEIKDVVSEVRKSAENIFVRVESGVRLSEEATAILQNIANAANQLQEMLQTIASATEEMTITAETIARDIDSIAEATRELKVGVEQVVQATEEISKLGEELRGELEGF